MGLVEEQWSARKNDAASLISANNCPIVAMKQKELRVPMATADKRYPRVAPSLKHKTKMKTSKKISLVFLLVCLLREAS